MGSSRFECSGPAGDIGASLVYFCLLLFLDYTNADFILLLLLYKYYIPYEAMTEPRSPFLQFCPMVLSIEEIKTTKCGFDSCPFPVSQCFLFRVT